jgi:hypothetical protein
MPSLKQLGEAEIMIQQIFEILDTSDCGRLKNAQLSTLSELTGGGKMDGETYQQVCVAVGCEPEEGLKLAELRMIYLELHMGACA